MYFPRSHHSYRGHTHLKSQTEVWSFWSFPSINQGLSSLRWIHTYVLLSLWWSLLAYFSRPCDFACFPTAIWHVWSGGVPAPAKVVSHMVRYWWWFYLKKHRGSRNRSFGGSGSSVVSLKTCRLSNLLTWIVDEIWYYNVGVDFWEQKVSFFDGFARCGGKDVVDIAVVVAKFWGSSVVSRSRSCEAYPSCFLKFGDSWRGVELRISSASVDRHHILPNIRQTSRIFIIRRPWNFVIFIW